MGQRWCNYSRTGPHGCTQHHSVCLCELKDTSVSSMLTWPYLCLYSWVCFSNMASVNHRLWIASQRQTFWWLIWFCIVCYLKLWPTWSIVCYLNLLNKPNQATTAPGACIQLCNVHPCELNHISFFRAWMWPHLYHVCILRCFAHRASFRYRVWIASQWRTFKCFYTTWLNVCGAALVSLQPNWVKWVNPTM